MRFWILAILFYGIGDTVTTIMNLRSGCVELNPIVNFVIGGGELAIIPLKVLIISCCYYLYRETKSRMIPVMLLTLGLICVVINVLVHVFR